MLKILKFFGADPDPGSEIFLTLDLGSGMKKFGSGIRDKYPASATLLKTNEDKFKMQVILDFGLSQSSKMHFNAVAF